MRRSPAPAQAAVIQEEEAVIATRPSVPTDRTRVYVAPCDPVSLAGIGMRDWKSFERAVAQGYAHASLEIEKHGVPFSDSWTAGPAVSMNRHRSPA